MALKFKIIPVTPFQQNCTVLWCDETKEAAVSDPGGDLDRVLPFIEQNGLTLTKIILTHCHLDHASATQDLHEMTGVPIEGPQKADQFWIDNLVNSATMYGFPIPKTFTPTRWLEQGDTVTIGNEILEVRHCPGHTPGHVIFYSPTAKLAWVGDVLFNGSIGRYDFPKSNYQDLMRSIKEQLYTLDDDVQFISGHGPMSTIGYEKQTNPLTAGLAG